jgi:hypothetical protein
MKTYQWEDYLGPLPQLDIRLSFSRNNVWIESYQKGKLVKVGRRARNGQWVSFYSNLRIEEGSNHSHFDLIRIEEPKKGTAP